MGRKTRLEFLMSCSYKSFNYYGVVLDARATYGDSDILVMAEIQSY